MHNDKGKILSALLVALGLLFAAGHAQAQPAPQCGDASINHDGNVDLIPLPGQNDCIIAGGITVTNGFLRIRTPNGKIQVGGNISTTSNATSSGNIVLDAARTIEVGGSIIVNNASAPLGQAGSVDIKANNAGSGPAFVIGLPSSNGVAGTINTDTSVGGGNDPLFIRGGIRIRNRNDITLTSASALSVKGTASRSGVIILEAVDGNLSLPKGTLSADGQPGQSAGAIVLQAHMITTQDGTIVSASDSVGQLSHFVNIAAQTISYTGSTGLTIRANGGGSTANGTGSFVYALPEFGIFVTDDSTSNPQNFTWTVTYPFGTAYPGALIWSGTTGSPLTVTANGTTHTQLLMSGYPLTFGPAGDVLLSARGQQDHQINLVYTGATNGTQGLQVDSSKFTLNASATQGGSGGFIQIQVDKATLNGANHIVKADGPPTGNGDGGSAVLSFESVALGTDSKMTVSADAASSGTGNASTTAITFLHHVSDIVLGTGKQDFEFSAKGGQTGGNGGKVSVIGTTGNIRVRNVLAVDASAPGQVGNGGTIELLSDNVRFVTPAVGSNPVVSLNASGSTASGDGGRITTVNAKQTGQGVPLNVNARMKVDGDQSNNTGIFDGSISVNDVTCQQFKTTFDYPKTYWDCTVGAVAGNAVASAANTLEPQLKNVLGNRSAVTPANPTVHVYVMPIVGSFLDYFGVPAPASGTTAVYGLGINPIRVAAAFVKIKTGNGQIQATAPLPPASMGSPTILKASIVHELGHHLDYIWGNVSSDVNHPQNAAYLQNRTNDLTRLLNSGACGNAFTAATCNNNAVQWATLNNLQIYGSGDPSAQPPISGLGYSTSNIELLPIVFAHLEGVNHGGQFAAMPDLEMALQTQFLDLKPFVQGLINNPPPAVN